MAARVDAKRPPLITSARISTSLSTDQRAKRYVITMMFRVVAFLAAVVSPAPWNLILFVAAAVLPAVAVLLGNAKDNRKPDLATDDVVTDRPALGSGEIVRGDVAEDADAAHDAPGEASPDAGPGTGAGR